MRKSVLAVAGLFASIVPSVLAQEPAPAATTGEPEAGYEEEIFVEGTAGTAARSASVAAKFEVPLQETPAAVSVVTRALSLEQNAETVDDALRNVSGANVHTNVGVHDFFLLRGFDSLSAGLVLTDGIAEPEATFYHLYNVERVEVLRGPASFLYGGNALAGAVNLLRLTPSRTRSFWGVGAGGGSFGSYRGHLDANWVDREGRFGFRLNGLWRESDGFRDDTPSRTLAVNPVLDFNPSAHDSLRLSLERVDNDASPDAGVPVSGTTRFDVPRERSYQSPFDFSEQKVTRLRFDWSATRSSSLTLRNKLYYSELDWQSDGTLLNAVVPLPPTFAPYVFRTLVPLDDDQRFYGDEFEAVFGTDRHDLVVGLELGERRDEFDIQVGMLPPIALYDPVETAVAPPPPIPGLGQTGDATQRIVAPYFLDRAILSEEWQVFWGARLDLLDYEDEAVGVSTDDSQLSPMLGVVWAPSPRLSAYLNASRSFSPPSTRAQGALDPEKGEQIELGLKGSLLEGRLLGSLSLYQIERDDMAIFDDNGLTAQIGSQRSRGLEAELAGHVGSLRYQIACAYNDSELTAFNELVQLPPTFVPMVIDRSGNDPAFTPRQTWNFWLAHTFRNGLGVGGGGRYVDRYYIAEDNAFEVDSALTIDATVYWNLERWRLALNLENLTDEEYDTRGFGGSSVIPAAGTSAFLTIDYRM